MKLRPLPEEVDALLNELGAPPRLVAHLTLVHDVACTLTDDIDAAWPDLSYDRAAVRFGAATHDIGKAVHQDELIGPGRQHEEMGLKILKGRGFPEGHCRFAWTHGGAKREPNPTLEDLLVRLSDAIWKGLRKETLEAEICNAMANMTGNANWEVFMKLDDIICGITNESDQRLHWQNLHSV